MTSEQKHALIKQAIERQTEANTASPAAARAALIRMGIYTSDGKLAPEHDPNEQAFSVRD